MKAMASGSRPSCGRFDGEARLGLVFLVLLGGSARSAFSMAQDGSWTGTTTQGRPYNFTVKGGGTAINPLEVGFSGCSTGTVTVLSPDIPITGNSFQTEGGFCPSFTTSGTFTSATTATGSVTFTWSYIPLVCPCDASATASWTATKAPPQADLSVVKTDSKTTVVAGSANVYGITVTNNGPEPVTSLTLTDAPPATLLNPVFTPSAGAYNPATGAWTGLSLGAGQSVVLYLSATVSPSASGTLTNTATVSAPAGVSDPVPGNNSATDTDTVVIQADVAVTKTGAGLLTPPTGLTYRIVVTNNGPSDAAFVQVADPTPAGLTFVANSGFCVSAFPCNLGAIPAGQARTIDATYTVPADYAGPDPVSNTATVTASTTDPNPVNNSATVSSQVVPAGPASNFFTIAPCRLLDTRDAPGAYGGPALVAGQDRTFAAVGPQCGLPATAKAVSVNLTVTAATVAGNLRLYPAGLPLPNSSTVNYVVGLTRANNAIVPLNGSGEFAIRCTQASGTAHAVVDVNGYFE
jgi:uncharacterized repeat protein (TIGR01451 family)